MADSKHICPVCFRLISAEAIHCPACGADFAALTARDYREKLVAALAHPLDDVRMRVILALGMRAEPDVAEALADCALRHPVDVVEGLAVVGSLARLGDAGRRALLRLAQDHSAHAVREAAHEAMTG